jgi:phosphoribosylaminoimidazolecarboxamide formyltransferase/IMP cyclohydrolase
MKSLQIRRALLSVSDKEGLVDLARSMSHAGIELVATGKTAQIIEQAGLKVTLVETISGNPEAFQGRMKTLSFPICSGILFRRGNAQDEQDVTRFGIRPIDCVVVNFYPFEKATAHEGISRSELIEQVDIGGPTLVRAAAKNSPDVLVLTSPAQYGRVIQELTEVGQVQPETIEICTQEAWDRVLSYDTAIAKELGSCAKRPLRYGENPHQKGHLEFDPQGPIAWGQQLTATELSYNNILDLSAAYAVASDLIEISPDSTGVVIVKHNNPCGMASVPKSHPEAQMLALKRAWEGDPVSAFGGVVVFTDPIQEDAAKWLSQYFVELVAAPGLTKGSSALQILSAKRKNLKAVQVRRFGETPQESMMVVPGGRLFQSMDTGTQEEFRSVTRTAWPSEKDLLGRFGVAVTRALKSNAIAIVREIPGVVGAFQLIGAGQGQPNRIDALQGLAIPRAQNVLRASEGTLGECDLRECVMISDAFFPFRDTVDAAAAAGLKWIVQPGGSQRDSESITACDEHGVAMAFTGKRHFRH